MSSLQASDSTGVVTVVMRHQNSSKLEPVALQKVQYRAGVTRIDHRGNALLVIGNRPDIVIGKCRNRLNH